jgi:hypothetical protein
VEVSGRRCAGVVVAGAALLLAACTAVPATPSSSAAAPPAGATPGPTPSSLVHYALTPACPRPGRPVTIQDAGLLNQEVAGIDLPGWQAADIGASARLSDGRIVWVFGDTFRVPSIQPRLVANSMLITSLFCVSQLVAPGNGPVIPDSDDGTVLWPMSATVLSVAGDDVLIVLCSRIRRGGGQFSFTFLGTSAAVFDVPPGGRPALRQVEQITPDDDDSTQINWGAAAVVHGSWLYTYGTRLSTQQYVFGRALYVARSPVADPDDRTGWQFWDGARWQGEIGRAVPVLPAAGGVSQTLSVSYLHGGYVAVSKRDGDLGGFVYTWTAANPAGPWRPHRSVAAPAGFHSGALQYAPLAHPEVPLASGKLLVSISRNTTDLSALNADPDIGRPRFVEVSPGD